MLGMNNHFNCLQVQESLYLNMPRENLEAIEIVLKKHINPF